MTVQREHDLRAARWDEVDLEAAERRIPAERMKMRAPHIVPLSRQANELELHGEGGLVFSTQCRAAMYIHSFHKHKLAATLWQNGVSILSDINALQTQLAGA
jgi:integrase